MVREVKNLVSFTYEESKNKHFDIPKYIGEGKSNLPYHLIRKLDVIVNGYTNGKEVVRVASPGELT